MFSEITNLVVMASSENDLPEISGRELIMTNIAPFKDVSKQSNKKRKTMDSIKQKLNGKILKGVGETDQMLRALAALAGCLRPAPSTHMVVHSRG